jgi:hypothetical protein
MRLRLCSCQSLARDKWLQQRKAELLPVEYFHVVFTIPEQLAAIAFQNKAVVYDILFRATAETLRTLDRVPARILSTGARALTSVSPLVSRGPGESFPRQSPAVLLRFRAVARSEKFCPLSGSVARGRMGGLRQASFRQQVLEYLGRYTHRVAISNQRLLGMQDGQVCFGWKDYKHEQRPKTMTLSAAEFIRRFLLHALPPGFQRIRYYGLFANAHRRDGVTLCRKLLLAPVSELLPCPAAQDYRDLYEALTGESLRRCPQCGVGAMILIEVLARGQSYVPAPLDWS